MSTVVRHCFFRSQNIDFRLRKVEESAEQILSTLAVIHRFMSAHTSIQENHGSSSNISTDNRQRGIGYTENPHLQVKTIRFDLTNNWTNSQFI